jgi:hypothetical protein
MIRYQIIGAGLASILLTATLSGGLSLYLQHELDRLVAFPQQGLCTPPHCSEGDQGLWPRIAPPPS